MRSQSAVELQSVIAVGQSFQRERQYIMHMLLKAHHKAWRCSETGLNNLQCMRCTLQHFVGVDRQRGTGLHSCLQNSRRAHETHQACKKANHMLQTVAWLSLHIIAWPCKTLICSALAQQGDTRSDFVQ